MKYNLDPDIGIPTSQEKIENKINAEFTRFTGHQAVLTRSNGLDPDAGRGAAQSSANFDHLLDHWPNGAPRDYLVQYATKKAIQVFQPQDVPENIVLGD